MRLESVCPSLHPLTIWSLRKTRGGSVVILDNLRTHKSPHAAEALREAKSWFLFLPPYSPDPNPIEHAFSKLKAHLRRIGARTYDDLIAAIGDVCALFGPAECWNFFEAAGYASD